MSRKKMLQERAKLDPNHPENVRAVSAETGASRLLAASQSQRSVGVTSSVYSPIRLYRDQHTVSSARKIVGDVGVDVARL